MDGEHSRDKHFRRRATCAGDHFWVMMNRRLSIRCWDLASHLIEKDGKNGGGLRRSILLQQTSISVDWQEND